MTQADGLSDLPSGQSCLTSHDDLEGELRLGLLRVRGLPS